tara:strand:- start:539 stop:1714 length:1176 start_codon:yes stop_codon:yes gene_type:complete
MVEQVKGTQNITDDASSKYLFIRNLFTEMFVNYGYSYLQTPHLEYTELFEKSIGKNSEIVSKQMYQFTDKGGRSLVLRPEGTSSIVRYHSQYQKELTKQYAYFGQMFRYENPQKNRYREFTQGGVEIVGNIDEYSDYQVINDSIRFLNKLDLDFVLEINTIGSIEDREAYSASLVKYFKINESKLSTESREKLSNNTLRILDSNNPADLPVINDAPEITEFINTASMDKYENLKKLLTNNQIKFKENTRLVRGLDYYNDLTFEFVNNDGLVLGGGGRYDKLAEILNIGSFNGVGVAFGIERIMNSISPKNYSPYIYLIGSSIDKISKYSQFLDEKDLSYFKPPRLSKINTQFKYAKNLNVKYVINTDEDTIKDLENNTSVNFEIGVLIENK